MDQMKIGSFIQKNRKKKGMTQQQLADVLHVSNKAVSKWETGVNIPDTAMLVPLSEALDVSVLDLLMGSELNEADSSEVNGFATKLSESFNMIKSRYRIAAVFLIAVLMMVGGISLYRLYAEQVFLRQFEQLEIGDSEDIAHEKIKDASALVNENDQFKYLTPSGNVIVTEFLEEQGLIYAYEYRKDSQKVIRVIVPPFDGEYRLKDDGSIKIIFSNGRYEIKGTGYDYEEFIGALSRENGMFSNETVPEEYSWGYSREFYLDNNNHDIVLMCMGPKDFMLRMGTRMYQFHKYD